MPVAAVVLDMDGLMLDTEPIYKACWQKAAAELGYAIDDPFYSQFLGRPTSDCEREVAAKFGPAFSLPKFHDRWSQLWWETVGKGVDLKPGLDEFLALVESRNLPVAIATSSDVAHMSFALRHAGLADRFPVVVTGDTVARGKPAPDIYLAAARRLSVAPSECIALEDSDAGTFSATAAGMRVLLIPDWKAPSREAVAAAYRTLKSLYEAREVLLALLNESAADFESHSPSAR